MDVREKSSNEKRLIDADALLEQMKRTNRYFNVKFDIEEAPTIEADPVRHGSCPYCNAETNDFVPINQTVEYSGIEIALNRQGMLRVRVYESGQENFTTQDIVEIKYCPNCGAKMDGGHSNER